MARPQKSIVDYFPHQCNHKKTIYILENLYGNDGYAFWFKLLELLGKSEGHFFAYNNPSDWMFLLAITKVTEVNAVKILETLADLGTIDKELWQEKVIWSQNFVDNLEDVYKRRKLEKPKKPSICKHKHHKCKHKPDHKEVNVSNIPLNDSNNPQSKVKESRVKESRVKKSRVKPLIPFAEIQKLWNEKTGLAKIIALSKTRKDKIKLRWEEHPDLSEWSTLFATIFTTEFLKGENERGWRADFDWVMSNDINWLKIIEGKYTKQEQKKIIIDMTGDAE